MAEHEEEVKSFEIKYICDTCGRGYMEAIDAPAAGNPPKYLHYCTNCKQPAVFPVAYPFIDHRPTERVLS